MVQKKALNNSAPLSFPELESNCNNIFQKYIYFFMEMV